MTMPKTIESLTHITDRLSDILEQENQILVSRRPRELNVTLPEKERLVGMYERVMTDLDVRPETLNRLDQSDVSRLRQATGRFQDALEDHRRLVQTAKSVTERMVKAITSEIAKKDQPNIGYDRTGALRSGLNSAQAKPVTVTLNQTV